MTKGTKRLTVPAPSQIAHRYKVTVKATDGSPGVPPRVVSAVDLQKLYVAMGFEKHLRFELFVANVNTAGRATLENKQKTATLIIEPSTADFTGYVN